MRRKIKFSIWLVIALSLFLTETYGQNVGFNHVTGTANVSVPLYSVGQVPVGLHYNAGGIRVRQVAGLVGMGWNLSAGGNISREIKGLADDLPGKGWLNNAVGSSTAGQIIENFTVPGNTNCDNSSEKLTVEKLDLLEDTEPDLFYINTPLVSGTFVFDKDGVPQLQPYQNLLVEYEMVDGQINSFELTDDMGTVYTFSVVDKATSYVNFQYESTFFKTLQDHISAEPANMSWHLSKIVQPDGQYVVFDYTISKSTGDQAQKSYYEGMAKSYYFRGSAVGNFGMVYIQNQSHTIRSISSSSGERVDFLFTRRNDDIVEHRLVKVEQYQYGQPVSAFHFSYADVYHEGMQNYVASEKTKEFEKRTFLKSVVPEHLGQLNKGYEFDYHGVYDLYTKLPYIKSTAVDLYGFYKKNSTNVSEEGVIYYYPVSEDLTEELFTYEQLVDSHPAKSTEVILVRDLIPTIYYNPALSGENQYRVEPLPANHTNKSSEIVITEHDRSVDPEGLHYGSLSKISYPTGGNTRLYYEANTYYDPTAGTTYYGPGIRLAKTIVHDGVSNANNIVTEYTYHPGAQTSGVGTLVNRPVFAFGAPYRTFSTAPNLWGGTGSITTTAMSYEEIMSTYNAAGQARELSVRTNFDMSPGYTTVLYEKVEVANPGNGKTAFYFDIAATIDELTANNGEWEATTSYLAGECDYVQGRFRVGQNSFPFAYNPNYDFERGLLSAVEAYNEAGNRVSRTAYTYTRTNPASANTAVYGAVVDRIPSYKSAASLPSDAPYEGYFFYAYAKYRLFTNTTNSLSTITQTLYDPDNTSQSLTTTTTHRYDPGHGRPAGSETTDEEGTVMKSYVKYVADYSIGTPSSAPDSALAGLQSRHMTGVPVEQYSTVQPQGASEKVVTASVTTFNNHGANLPYQQFVLNKTAAINLSDFTPSDVVNGAWVQDANYELTSTMLKYDDSQRLMTVLDERSGIKSGMQWAATKNLVKATISNGGAENFLLSDFNNISQYSMKYERPSGSQMVFVQGRADGSALKLFSSAGHQLIGALEKDDNTENLVLSVWLKPTASGTITCKLKDETESTVYKTANINFTASSEWTYYEKLINVASLPSSFKASITTGQTVIMDEVLLYPEEATVSYSSYGSKGELLANSQAGKTSSYYEYDDRLRMLLVRDDDKNIRSQKEYTDIEIEWPITYDFVQSGMNAAGDAIFEFVHPDAVGDDTLVWDFGDGSDPEPMSAGQTKISHHYTYAGVYPVTLQTGTSDFKYYYQTADVTGNYLVSLEASGPAKMDLCEPYADEVYFDSDGSPPVYRVGSTHFRLGDFENCSDCSAQPLTYNWWVKVGIQSWSNVSAKSEVDLLYNETYEVKCEVEVGGNNPLTITSDTKKVIVYKSDSSCPNLSLD